MIDRFTEKVDAVTEGKPRLITESSLSFHDAPGSFISIITAQTLWVTGVSQSQILISLAEKLNWPLHNYILPEVPVYRGKIKVHPQTCTLFDILFVGMKTMGPDGIRVNIGMDIISQGTLNITNDKGHPTFSWRYSASESLSG